MLRSSSPSTARRPKYAGQNRANPTALILSGALILRHIGETDAGAAVEEAVKAVIGEQERRSPPTSAARPGRRPTVAAVAARVQQLRAAA